MTKKNSRRIVAVMMALVLSMATMFAMTTSVFAAGGSTNVQIQMYGDTYINENVTDAQIAASAGASGHLYTIPDGLTQPAAYTAADAMMQAYTNFYGSFDATQVAYGWDTSWAGHEGLFFTTYDGMSSDAGNYYLVRTYTDAGKTMYEYYWEGDSWNLYTNGSTVPTTEYASRYDLANVTSIVFDYNTTRSENFTTDYYIPGSLPAPVK